ncbi:hypothetical protein HON36_01935 [Candidatus Parcubacteria bacterium]|jgi:hypothetical protein|nr:hypothetical protein [Candidatus Parcubacteria bacterium]MBT7228436.1 hypothetical protein [Candidatus Parcubacteria bacterium]
MAKVCKQLKTSLGEAFYLSEQMQVALDKKDYQLAKSSKDKIEGIFIGMNEPLDWAYKAKYDGLANFLRDYMSTRTGQKSKFKWGLGETWSLDEAMDDYCEIDIENRKIIIREDIHPASYNITLPENLMIKGSLTVLEWMKVPEDLIVEGDVTVISPNGKLYEQLAKMHDEGQITGMLWKK